MRGMRARARVFLRGGEEGGRGCVSTSPTASLFKKATRRAQSAPSPRLVLATLAVVGLCGGVDVGFLTCGSSPRWVRVWSSGRGWQGGLQGLRALPRGRAGGGASYWSVLIGITSKSDGWSPGGRKAWRCGCPCGFGVWLLGAAWSVRVGAGWFVAWLCVQLRSFLGTSTWVGWQVLVWRLYWCACAFLGGGGGYQGKCFRVVARA